MGEGVVARVGSAPAKSEMAASLAEWLQDMELAGIRDARRQHRKLVRIADDLDWDRHADVTAADVTRYLRERMAGEHGPEIGAKTRNNILCALQVFLDFARANGYREDNPARSVPLMAAEQAETAGSGAFTFEEFRAIVAAAEADEAQDEPRFGYPRSVLYRLLWYAAMRVGQASKHLAWEDLDLGDEPTVTLRKGGSKNRKSMVLPLHQEAAEALRRLRARTPDPRGPIFGRAIHDSVLEADMDNAGVPKAGPDGRTRMFHAFRAGMATHMAQAGVHPKFAQKLLTHADIRITLEKYTHSQISDLRRVVTSLEGLRAEKSEIPLPDELTTEREIADSLGGVTRISSIQNGSHPPAAEGSVTPDLPAAGGCVPSDGFGRQGKRTGRDSNPPTPDALPTLQQIIEATSDQKLARVLRLLAEDASDDEAHRR